MKYMHFNSSCAYAGVANLLLEWGVDTEDTQIALDMGLPYLFAREDGGYLAGPMLQTARWFNLYLRPLGLTMVEETVPKAGLCGRLARGGMAMLGLRMPQGTGHAVVFQEVRDGVFYFVNNKWETSQEPERLELGEEDLLERARDTVTLAYLQKAPAEEIPMGPLFSRSAETLERLAAETAAFAHLSHTQEEHRVAMDTLFRPLLLDAVTMLELLRENEIREKLLAVQREYLRALREGTGRPLEQSLSMALLREAAGEYAGLIRVKAGAAGSAGDPARSAFDCYV